MLKMVFNKEIYVSEEDWKELEESDNMICSKCLTVFGVNKEWVRKIGYDSWDFIFMECPVCGEFCVFWI